MADERTDPWSAGVTAEEPGEVWPPMADHSDDDQPSRLHTGRWMSPSLGAYDPSSSHEALQEGDGANDDYFREFGYGESFGDGRLAAGYDAPLAAGSGPAEPPAVHRSSSGPRPADPEVAAPALDWDAPRPKTADGPTGWADLTPGASLDDEPRMAAPIGSPDRPRPPERDHRSATPAFPTDEVDIELDDADGRGDDDDDADDTRRNLIEWGVVLVGAVLLALVLRALVLQAFWIPSPSMETTLLVRDRVLVNKVSYRLHDINRGDVVVFRRTDDEIAVNPELPHDVIKRVIALGGETIEIRDNQVFIDGLLLQEPYLDEGVITTDFGPETVPEGHVFVMGDNRELSLDSRFETGPVDTDRVVGRAFFLFWPLNRLGAL